MPQPTPYDRITNLQNDQALEPSAAYPAPVLDQEYNAVKITTDEILQNLELIQRDDGQLQNDSVGIDQLRDEVLLGFDAPVAWETDADYIVGNTVFQDNGFWYCTTAHTSTVFFDDFTAGYWTLIADFTSAAAVGAVMSISDGPPALPIHGQQWYESDSGETYVYYDDGDSAQWVHMNGNIIGGGEGIGEFLPLEGGDLTGNLAIDGDLSVTGTAEKPGGGTWADSSDLRIKNVIGDYTRGLTEVLALRPIYYTYKGNDTNVDVSADGARPTAPYPDSPHYQVAVDAVKFAGFVAQEAETVLPELVKSRDGFIDGKAVTDLRTLDTSPLIFALVNSIKELSTRIDTLHQRIKALEESA